MDQDEAEDMFLNDVKLLTEYGLHFYKLFKVKRGYFCEVNVSFSFRKMISES